MTTTLTATARLDHSRPAAGRQVADPVTPGLAPPDSGPAAQPATYRKRPFDPASPLRISPYGPSDQAPTTAFEREFRRRIAELGSVVRRGAPTPRRSTITALLTALRSGISADRLLAVARGLTPQDLADAYDHVARTRAQARSALDRLIEDPTIECFDAEREAIASLLPQMAASLSRLAEEFPDSLPAAVENLAEQMQELERSVDVIEERIEEGSGDWWVHVAELDDGRSGGIQHHPCYCPRRVGDIVPVRLAYLMGDHKQDDEP